MESQGHHPARLKQLSNNDPATVFVTVAPVTSYTDKMMKFNLAVTTLLELVPGEITFEVMNMRRLVTFVPISERPASALEVINSLTAVAKAATGLYNEEDAIERLAVVSGADGPNIRRNQTLLAVYAMLALRLPQPAPVS